jgi:signal transduction histidine kinase
MNIQLSASQWKSLRPALVIGLLLALLQIGSGVVAYYQSKNLLWEGKFQAAQNLARGLVVAVADQMVVRDYAAAESRIVQTMANLEVASVALTDLSGRVLIHMAREVGGTPRLVFGETNLTLPQTVAEVIAQTRDDTLITTWAKIQLGIDVGWIRLQTHNTLDNDDLSSLRQQTLLLSALAVLSGSIILGVFIWRVYFAVVKREHFIEMKLDETANRLLQSEKLASLGQLAAGVAHEINNPIGYVSSNVATLKKYLAVYERVIAEPNDKNRSTYQAIQQEVQPLFDETQEGIARVKNIVQDLKDFSRSNATAQFVQANIFQGLQSTLNIVNHEVKHTADIVLKLGDAPEIECVPSQINQVFMNLIVNAAHAIPTDKRGCITIESGHDDTHVWFDVADDGCGMNPQTLSKIFDPFFTTKSQGQGTGLGLSVSFGIVQRHGGNITAHSEEGVGSRFRVTLPIRQSQEPSRSKEHVV